MTDKKNRGFRKKRYLIPALLLILLLIFRLYLPTLVKNHVNQVLAEIPGYYGQVEDIDIALLRGAYVINGMYLNKTTAKTEVPFLKFPETDISIEWKSLFRGKIVSEIIMHSPELIYVFEDQQTDANADVKDWTKALTDLVPIDINHFAVHNGKLAFVQISAEPNIDLQIAKLELTADNLRNVVAKERILPSPIRATGVSVGNGKVSLEGNMNIMREIPDMDLAFSLENADIRALNSFSSHYAGIDFESGNISIYSEVAIANAHLIGYIKPLLSHTKLIGKEDSFLEILWEGFVGFFKFILKNQGTDTLATKVPIEGDLNDVEAGVFPTVFNIFKNSWIKAFQGGIDQEISFEDAMKDPKLTSKEKQELRKKERDRKRAERKKQQEMKKG